MKKGIIVSTIAALSVCTAMLCSCGNGKKASSVADDNARYLCNYPKLGLDDSHSNGYHQAPDVADYADAIAFFKKNGDYPGSIEEIA